MTAESLDVGRPSPGDEVLSPRVELLDIPDAPIQPDQEWANALTHGIAAKLSLFGAGALVFGAAGVSTGLAWACLAYMSAVFATFLSSFLSHFFLKQPWLNTFRAWDQAMIYTMIVGTYTPIVWAYTTPPIRTFILVAMWVAAIAGAVSKVVYRHRLNNISPWPYLALGWAPAAVLYFATPPRVSLMMVAGGLFYCGGVYFLMNDRRGRYFHAVWHLFVITASALHYVGMWRIVWGA